MLCVTNREPAGVRDALANLLMALRLAREAAEELDALLPGCTYDDLFPGPWPEWVPEDTKAFHLRESLPGLRWDVRGLLWLLP
jgi:hypothetical protein